MGPRVRRGKSRLFLAAGLIALLCSLLVVRLRPVVPALTQPDERPPPLPGQTLRDSLADDSAGPAMIVVAAGSVWMGSDSHTSPVQSESPRHLVTITGRIAVAQTETTVAEFRKFMNNSGYRISPGCWYHSQDEEWLFAAAANWEAPGYQQTETFPVSCLNWEDAVAYAAWLTAQTGNTYRLPSEAEFEYFNRAGMSGDYAFEMEQYTQLCGLVNGADATTGLAYANACSDGFSHASPVGQFKSNGFSLSDTSGNLWEFTADCWNGDYRGGWRTFFSRAPVDGRPWKLGNCSLHVIRGGSYLSSVEHLRLTWRESGPGKLRLNRQGLRLVREL